ncbi:MAG TPA: ATP-binding protein [Burkholderiaceae bacterium]
MALTSCAIYGITAVFQNRIIEHDAIRSAEIVATEVQVSRTTFSEKVANKLKKEGFGVSLDFEQHPGFVPIPAQYLRLVGADIQQQSMGLFNFNLLSKWNLHQNQGLHDDFQRWAWGKFEQQDLKNPIAAIDWQPLWRIEDINGTKTLRYMRADPAADASCVECHNEQEKRPEIIRQRVAAGVTANKIWKRNQLLGAIEVQIPLDRMEKLAANQERILLLIMLVSLGGLGVAAFFSVRKLWQEQSASESLAEKNALIELNNQMIQQKNAELEQANQALAKTNRMQEEQRSELTRFLAVASHDLRQPMHALSIYLGALTGSDLPKPARSILDSACDCASILDGMFLALLNLSQLDAQVIKPVIETFPISSLLSHLAVEFAPQAHAKGIDFQIEPCSAWVQSDAALVGQILSNLIANAVRYTQKGFIKISCEEHDGRLKVAVHDTGIGISAEQKKTVFEEFFQLANSNRDVRKGLGLGLAIVKRLSKLLDIPIALDSTVGAGSTFSIELRRIAPRLSVAPPVRALADNSQVLHGKTVVVVDDEESILDAMSILLQQWGCLPITAKQSEEAVKILVERAGTPDVLICDYRLGLNETGLDVIESLRAEFNFNIPALLITGDTAPNLFSDSQPIDIIVLHKPVEADALHKALIQLLSIP